MYLNVNETCKDKIKVITLEYHFLIFSNFEKLLIKRYLSVAKLSKDN